MYVCMYVCMYVYLCIKYSACINKYTCTCIQRVSTLVRQIYQAPGPAAWRWPARGRARRAAPGPCIPAALCRSRAWDWDVPKEALLCPLESLCLGMKAIVQVLGRLRELLEWTRLPEPPKYLNNGLDRKRKALQFKVRVLGPRKVCNIIGVGGFLGVLGPIVLRTFGVQVLQIGCRIPNAFWHVPTSKQGGSWSPILNRLQKCQRSSSRVRFCLKFSTRHAA